MKTVSTMLEELGSGIEELCLDYDFTQLTENEQIEFKEKAKQIIDLIFVN